MINEMNFFFTELYWCNLTLQYVSLRGNTFWDRCLSRTLSLQSQVVGSSKQLLLHSCSQTTCQNFSSQFALQTHICTWCCLIGDTLQDCECSTTLQSIVLTHVCLCGKFVHTALVALILLHSWFNHFGFCLDCK